MKRNFGLLGKSVALIGAAAALFQSTTVGLGFTAYVPMLDGVQSAFQRAFRGPVPAFSDRPTQVRIGANPSRDENRDKWFTPQLRRDLENRLFERALSQKMRRGDFLMNFAPIGLASLAAMGGGGESGGGGPGDGGGPGGGSTTGGGSTGGGSTGGLGGPGGLGGMSNTNTGNKLSTLHLTGWSARGLDIDFTLYHNSRGTYNNEFGHGWSHTYDVNILYTSGSSAIVRMEDGLLVPYTETMGTFTAPPGWNHDLVKHMNGTWTLTFKDQVEYNFDTDGNLISIVDRNSNQITITRDTGGEILEVQDATGRKIEFTYSSGRVSGIEDPSGRIWEFVYGTYGDLEEVHYPEINSQTPVREFTYSASHEILTEKDLRGEVWTWTYDNDGKVLTLTDPLSNTTSYSYTTSATTITLPGSQTIVHNYDEGALISAVDPNSFSYSIDYDGDFNVVKYTDKRGKEWTYTYDSKGNRLTATNPLNETTTWAYNSLNDVISVKNPLNQTTEFTYNGSGNLTVVTDPLANDVVTLGYGSHGLVTSVTDATSKTTSYGYNSHGSVNSVTDPAAVQLSAGYDILSRPVWIENGAGSITTNDYDELGRITTVTHPGGTATISLHYDLESNLTGVTDELSGATTLAYDDAMRLISVTNPLSQAENYVYDVNSRVVEIENARGKTREYTYSARGEVLSLTMADNLVESWTYDASGNVTMYTDPGNIQTSYVYNDARRMILVDYPTQTDTELYYDAAGRLVEMVDATGTVEWTYDATGRLLELAQPGAVLEYAYDAAGRTTGMTDSVDGAWTYSYDGYGRISSIENPFSETTSLTYDSAGRVSTKTFNDGQYETFGYDSRSRLVSVVLKDSTHNALLSQSYTWNAASEVVEHIVGSLVTEYEYDNAGRLTKEEKSSGYLATYTYDANGNRLTRTVNSATDYFSYDDADKLLEITGAGGTRTYAYDSSGRTSSITTSTNVRTFSYTDDSRIAAIDDNSVVVGSYGYGGFGTRTSKTENSVSNSFIRNGMGVTAPVLRDSNASYTAGISEKRGTDTTYQHSGLKNMEAQSDANETISASQSYDAFGNVIAAAGTWQGPFDYAGNYGYQQDATGYMLLGHRYYDPDAGRFLTRDPAMDGSNWWAYCENNPIGKYDDNGLAPVDIRKLNLDYPHSGRNRGRFSIGFEKAVSIAQGGGNVVVEHPNDIDQARNEARRIAQQAYGKDNVKYHGPYAHDLPQGVPPHQRMGHYQHNNSKIKGHIFYRLSDKRLYDKFLRGAARGAISGILMFLLEEAVAAGAAELPGMRSDLHQGRLAANGVSDDPFGEAAGY